MYMVACSKIYWPFVLELRNNLREYFFDQHIITEEEHEKFMSKYYENYYVCIADSQTVGWVGVVNNDVRVAVAPEYHKRGIGKFMLQYVKDRYPKGTAQIAASNVASIKLFESVGIPIREII